MSFSDHQEAMNAAYGPADPRWDEDELVFQISETETHLVQVVPLLFTAAVVTTPKSNPKIYDDRWCYHSVEAAIQAADQWEPAHTPEPEGWHRHPVTGRRRPDGDPAREFINP